MITLELTETIKQQEIVTSFVYANESSHLILSLNHKYSEKTIVSPVFKNNWPKTIQTFTRQLKLKGVIKDLVDKLCDVVDNNFEKILDLNKDANEGSNDANQSRKQKVLIRKYTGNGTLPLHESIVIDGQPATFLRLGEEGKPQYVFEIATANKIFYPADTMDTRNPLPYIFESVSQLEEYLDLAKKETFGTLHSKVESIFKKYVNAEEHYIVILAADTIFSYFQDKFGTTHYNIFVGDNGSGKNSVLLVYRYLGYRVFYITAASAANYYTFMGDTEEGQGTTAEDEADDIGYDRDKQKILRTGYASGGFVPKVDLPNGGGRRQDSWLTFCHKWLAMEALPEYKKIKGILDRSFVYYLVAGEVPYNIKDVIKHAGDPKLQPLHDELMHIRKLLFAFRLVHYHDAIPDINLNIIHRNAELTKPLLRLFSYQNDSPLVLKRIRLALSKFIEKRNEQKRNSLESKLRDAINNLVEERKKNPEATEYVGLEPYSFYNEQIWAEVRRVTNGVDIPFKTASFYTVEYGQLSHKFITGLYRSKFKADRFKTGSGNETKRGLKFSKDILDRLGTYYYNVPDEIKIGPGYNSSNPSDQDNARDSASDSNQPATDATDATHHIEGKEVKKAVPKDSDAQNNENNSIKSSDLSESYSKTSSYEVMDDKKSASVEPLSCPTSVASVASVGPVRYHGKSFAGTENEAAVRLRDKVKEVGLPEIPCIFCDYKDCIEFDLVTHYLEIHKPDLFKLPIGKGSMEHRAEYAVELAKRKMTEMFEEVEEENEHEYRDDS